MAEWITIGGVRVDLNATPAAQRAAMRAMADKPAAPPSGVGTAPPPNQPAPEQGPVSPAGGAKYINRESGSGLHIWQLPDGTYIRATDDGRKWMGSPETVAAAERETARLAQEARPKAVKATTSRATVKATGVTIGEDEDYRAMASSVLKRLGFENEAMNMLLGEASTDTEVDMFIRGGMKDSASIELFYRTKPSLLAINPGLKYNLSREDYFRTRAAVETAFGQVFEEPGTAGAMRAKAANPTVGPAPAETDWVSAFFQEKFTPEESAGMFGDYFKRVGVAPTSQDIGLYRTRSKERYKDKAVEPAFRDIEDGRRGGPTTPGLTDPKRNAVFGRR